MNQLFITDEAISFTDLKVKNNWFIDIIESIITMYFSM